MRPCKQGSRNNRIKPNEVSKTEMNFCRHRIMNAATTGNVIPDDDKFVRQYHKGLIIAVLFAAIAAFVDGYFEVYGLSPQSFCMNDSSERNWLKILVLSLGLFPTISLAILTIFVEIKQYLLSIRNRQADNTLGNANQREQPLYNQIPFRSVLFSVAIAVIVSVLPPLYEFISWLKVDYNWIKIGPAFVFITVDLVKLPFQLYWTFRNNDQIQRRTTEDRRQALREHARQDRLKRNHQKLATIVEEELMEYFENDHKVRLTELRVYHNCFRENYPKVCILELGEFHNCSHENGSIASEAMELDVIPTILNPPPEIPFIDEEPTPV